MSSCWDGVCRAAMVSVGHQGSPLRARAISKNLLALSSE